MLRWGQSAYETEADLGLERAAATALGLGWARAPESAEPPDLAGVGALVVTSRVVVDDAALARFEGSLVLTTTSGLGPHRRPAAPRAGRPRRAVSGGAARRGCGAHRRGVDHVAPSPARARQRGACRTLGAGGAAGARADRARGAVVYVVGLGVIGRRVAALLRGFGATVLGTDPAGVPDGIRAVTLEDGLLACDAVTLHCGLGPGTSNLLSGARLALLRPTAVVVNTARGRVLDVDAAVAAVREGRLRGLAVDVFPEEPWPGLAAAATVEGVFTSPHASGYTAGLGRRVAAEVATALEAWASGRPVPHAIRS